jgi:signal transduction histidine kinase
LALTIFFEVLIIRFLLFPLEKIMVCIKRSQKPSSFDYDKILTSTNNFLYLQEIIFAMMHKIEKAFKSEREYISHVSHELFTPISIIQSKLELLINQRNLPDDELSKMAMG